MTIDREKLIQLLVGKTGFERERVEAQLSELINRIQEAAREGKSFEIEGFGTFSIKDDELVFEPADELETEVNHKYAGMEPIELIGAFDEGEEEAEEEPEPSLDTDTETVPDMEAEVETETEDEPGEPETEEDIFGLDEPKSPLADEISKARTEETGEPQEPAVDEEGGAESPEEEIEEPETTEEDIDEVLESLEDESAFEELEKDPEPEHQTEPEPEPDRETEAGVPEPEEDSEEVFAKADQDLGQDADEYEDEEEEEFVFAELESEPEEEAADRWEPGTELTGPGEPKPKKKKQDPIGRILVVFVVIVAVGVSGWLAYDMGLFSGIISSITGGDEVATSTVQPQTQSTTPSQQQAAPPQQQQSQPGGQSAGGQGGGDRQQSVQSAEPETETEVATGDEEPDAAADAQATQPLYGLKGTLNPDANTGYTIVVHSLQSESNARELRDELAREGFRAILSQAVVNGNNYWRVGLGQFETVGDAQNAAGTLRASFRNNFFIKRIR